MSRRSVKEEQVKMLPNAKRKLITMIICIVVMVFSITQVYYLARYTLGLEVSSKNMAVYNWVLKLVSYDEVEDENLDYEEAK